MRRIVAILACLALLGGCAVRGAKDNAAELLSKAETSDLSAEQEARLGDRSLDQGQLDQALIHFNRALNKEPGNPAYMVRRGRVLSMVNMDEAALKEFQAVLAKTPDSAAANEGAGLVYFKTGLLREAEAHLRKALEQDPRLWRAQNALGVMDSHAGRYAEAVKRYETALAAHPGAGEVENNLGVAWLMLGDAEKALVHLRLAVKHGAGDARTYNNMGLALARLGRESEALEAFRYGGDEAKALNNLGYVFLLQGDNVRAARYFEQALQAAPSYYVRAAENLKRARMAGSFQEASGRSPEQQPLSLPSAGQSPTAQPRAVSTPVQPQAPVTVPAAARPAAPAKAPEALHESSLGPESAAPLRETVRSSVPVPTPSDVVPQASGKAVIAPISSAAAPLVRSAADTTLTVVPAVHTAPAAVRDGDQPWGVHVGSWRDLSDARRFARHVSELGQVPAICRVDLPEHGGVWFRVLSGRFASLHEAAAARPGILQALGLEQGPLYRLRDEVSLPVPPGSQVL